MDFIIDEVIENDNNIFFGRALKIGDWHYQINWHGQILFKTKETLKQIYNSYSTKYLVLNRGKYCIAATLWGRVLFKIKCDELIYLEDNIFKFRIGKLWGLIYKDGFQLIKPKYQEIFLGYIDAQNHHRRTYYAKLNDKFGVIYSNSEVVKPFIYDEMPEGKQENNEFIKKNKDKYADIIDLGVHRHFSSGDYFVKNDMGYWGLIKESGEIVFDYKYLSIDTFNMINNIAFENGTAYRVKNKKGKWGLIDNSENIILPFEFDYIMEYHHLSNNTLIVAKDKKFGLIDLKNNIRIDFKYKNLIDLNGYGDMFLAQNDNDKWAIINDKDEIINPDFEKIPELKLSEKESFYLPKRMKNFRKSDFIFDKAPWYWDEDSISLQKGSYSYIINTSGEILFKTKCKLYETCGKYFSFENNDKKFIVDKLGNILIKPIYDDIEYLYFRDYFKYYKNGKWGIIKANGKVLIKEKYDNIRSCENNYFSVELNEKTGLIDEFDNVILPFEYDKDFNFIDDNKIIAGKDHKQGIINLKNETIIPFEYDFIYTPRNNYAIASKDEKYGLIDLNNNVIVPFEFANLSIMSDDTLFGNRENMDCINYLYDFKGNKICDTSFDYNCALGNDEIKTDYYIASHRHENCIGLADKFGKPIIDFKYKEFNPTYSKKENKFYFIVQNNLGAWGVIDIDNNVIIPFIYDDIKSSGDIDMGIIAGKNDLYGLIDLNNDILIDFKFKDIRSLNENGITFAQTDNLKWGLINIKGESLKYDLSDVKELKL